MRDPLTSSSVPPLHLRRASLILPQFDQSFLILFFCSFFFLFSEILFYFTLALPAKPLLFLLTKSRHYFQRPHICNIPIYLRTQCVLELATLLFIIISPFTNSFYISTIGIYLITAIASCYFLFTFGHLLKSIFECRLRARRREFRTSNTSTPDAKSDTELQLLFKSKISLRPNPPPLPRLDIHLPVDYVTQKLPVFLVHALFGSQ